MIRVGLIGFGAIGSAIVAEWGELAANYTITELCVRPSQVKAAAAKLPQARIVTTTGELRLENVDLVVEAAGQGALIEIAERVLTARKKLYTLSIGALADLSFSDKLTAIFNAGGGQLAVPAGALAGFDGLMALRETGMESLTYESVKPPLAWKGTAAETMADLTQLSAPLTFFRGTAREAARLFPKNANLAAAVALAGLGFDKTQVTLVADPDATGNTGRVLAHTPSDRLEISMAGESFRGNPKSSAIVSASVIAALRNAVTAVSFG